MMDPELKMHWLSPALLMQADVQFCNNHGVVCVALLFFVSLAVSSLFNLTVQVYGAFLGHH